MFTYRTMDVNTIIKRALIMIRAESIYQDENQDARAYILDALNDILSLMNMDGDYLPYYKSFTFNLIPNQQTYILGTTSDANVILPYPIATLDFITIRLNQFQYPIIIQDNFGDKYNSRPTNITGRPRWCWVLPQEDQMRIEFWPTPDTTYACDILYKENVPSVAYQDVISLPASYRSLIVYWLAKRVNSEGGYGTWSDENQQQLDQMETTIKATMSIDNRVRSFPPYTPYPGWYSTQLGVITR